MSPVDDAAAVKIEAVPAEESRRIPIPSAGVVTSLGLGIWIGWTFSGVNVAEDIALWIGVLMAGLGGGRLFRRSLLSRRNRRR